MEFELFDVKFLYTTNEFLKFLPNPLKYKSFSSEYFLSSEIICEIIHVSYLLSFKL